MSKITYLFGAGASANALPVVNGIPIRLEKLIEYLEKEEFILDSNSTFNDLNIKNLESKRNLQLELIESLKWLLNASKNHASVDTFAKKLYLKNDYQQLRKLKIALSIFFIFEQINNKPDFRYDAFYASILNDIDDFPGNIKIVSWNYDNQFELSFSEYIDTDDISTIKRVLRINSKYGYSKKNNGFGIYKLNGTLGISEGKALREYSYISKIKGPIDKHLIEEVTRNYTAVSTFTSIYPMLSFAWENEDPDGSIVLKTIENIEDSEVLVVIGYSFPFFNREIDRKIIGSMINLKRVYLQAPDADILKERFQLFTEGSKEIELIPKFDVGQFLLPNEL